METYSTTPYKAASSAAFALANGESPSECCLQALVQQRKTGSPTQQKAFDSFLRGFHRPQLVRLLASRTDSQGEALSYANQLGQTLILFKSPLPGETQARLAYECFLRGFLDYLQQTLSICTLRDTSAHAVIFIPSGQNLDLEETWQAYVQETFSLRGLTESFVLLLNSVQLASRGFGVLDVPIVSSQQKNLMAGFYLAAVREVERRLQWRARLIHTMEQTLVEAEGTQKRKEQTEKRLQQLQNKQLEEIEKYRNAFTKAFTGYLTKAEKALQKIQKQREKNTKTSRKEQERDPTLKREQERSEAQAKHLQTMQELLHSTQGNPFRFIAQDRTLRPSIFEKAIQARDLFNEQAGNQMATAVGAKFAGVVLEAYRLLDGDVPLTPIPPLFSFKPVLSSYRPAGDAAIQWCYACGAPLEKRESTYEVRRLLFASPDQRPQSGFRAERPKACATCAAIALACPLKLSDQNVIIRLDPRGETPEATDYLRDYCRMLTIGTLNTSAGRYLSLVCTERSAQGILASTRLGKVVYTIAKLALSFPSDVFRDFTLTLIIEGSEVALDTITLFAATGFLRGYGQRIIVAGELNPLLGQIIRYLQAEAFYAAEYTIAAKNPPFRDEIGLERHREELWKFLKQQTEEQGMNEHAVQRAKQYEDVAALTGLLYAFCTALRARHRNPNENVGRILGKAIEYVDSSPAFFTYTAATNDLSSETARLYKDPSHHFLYDRTAELLGKLDAYDREKHDEDSTYLQVYFDDLTKAYTFFSKDQNYESPKDWKEFLYQVKLSLYSRFPECFSNAKDRQN